jgi:hypothetical protein
MVLFGLLVVAALNVCCWGGSFVVFWSAIIVVCCGCFCEVSCVAISGVGVCLVLLSGVYFL